MFTTEVMINPETEFQKGEIQEVSELLRTLVEEERSPSQEELFQVGVEERLWSETLAERGLTLGERPPPLRVMLRGRLVLNPEALSMLYLLDSLPPWDQTRASLLEVESLVPALTGGVSRYVARHHPVCLHQLTKPGAFSSHRRSVCLAHMLVAGCVDLEERIWTEEYA